MKLFIYMSKTDKLEWFSHKRGNGWKKQLLKNLSNL